MTGKAKLKTLDDMVSERVYMSSMYLSITFLLIAVLISEAGLPAIIYTFLGVFISIFTGTFLTTIVAKMTLDILTKEVSFLSKRTLKGALLIFVTFIFVLFVDNLDGFMVWLSKHIPISALEDESLSLVGLLIGSFFLYCTYWFYKAVIIPRIEQRSSNKQINKD
jgi:ABC-type multidrug transport system fused ATPase/permease subunit